MHYPPVIIRPHSIPWLFLTIAIVLSVFTPSFSTEPAAKNSGLVLTVDGPINPAVSDYISKGFGRAAEQEAGLIIIRMNTPGGLDASMRAIIRTILSSPVPVATYVWPDGARAASAGTYILYGSHIAAMAPATNLGAATPVQIGPMGGPKDEEQSESEDSRPTGTALERKIINDASAYIKALADKHGRNAEWAEMAVIEAVSLTAGEALELNVINIVAQNLDELLDQLDGRQVIVADEAVTLNTTAVHLDYFNQSWRYRLLGVISDPTIAYLLLLLGFYGLIYELANPGFLLPGVAGGIALMLALYALQLMPVNYSGLALMLLGICFLVGEAFMPSFGVLGIGGVIAFGAGSLILFDDRTLRVSLPAIITTTAVSALFILILMSRTVAMRRKPVHTGLEALVGTVGESRFDFDGAGKIWVNGECWNAQSTLPVKKGDAVRILSISGLELSVEPMQEES